MPLDPYTTRLDDGGPLYAETDTSRWIAEPWNAASALTFLVLVVYWVFRLRGHYRRHSFLCCCLPLLAAGGIGGMLYHALRSSRFFFLLDVVPISLLGLAASLYLWVRLSPRWWQPALVLVLFLVVTALGRGLPHHLGITHSYAMLAGLVLLPAILVMARTRLQHAFYLGLALACFGVALFFRFADAWRPPLLPMGTHWLWHLFGAGTTAALAEYLYRLGRISDPSKHDPRTCDTGER